MPQLTASRVNSLSRGGPSRSADGGGLYFIVPKSGSPYWALRYTSGVKRRQMTLGRLSDLSLADARGQAALEKRKIRQGEDPLAENGTEARPVLVKDVFTDWFNCDLAPRLKHPTIPQRIFNREIAPKIGERPIKDVTALEIRDILDRIRASDRPSIANDTLMYLKQLFRHANKMDFTQHNPAAAFTVNDAGGIEDSRDRVLSLDELNHVFAVFRENMVSFGRDNYLACCLLLVLGARKSEICEARWEEFDFSTSTWSLPAERCKTGVGINIPIPAQARTWLEELQIRAAGSKYVFPARRAGQHPHMGPDTLNRAISKLFGREPGREIQPPNKMGEIRHFTVHDIRRTFRSLAAAAQIPGHIAERCLNHKFKGVEGIYNRHDYFEERRAAHESVARLVQDII